MAPRPGVERQAGNRDVFMAHDMIEASRFREGAFPSR